MNVLAKIVIPRLLQSIAYILSEIEEKAREEFYRMKKIVQVKKKNRITIKTKHVCEECILCGAPKRDVSFIPIAPEEIEDPIIEQLSNFKKQIADIIAATTDLEQQNLLDETDSFVNQAKGLEKQLEARNKYAEDLRVKLQKVQRKRESDDVTECPDFVPAGIEYEDLCAKCQLTYIKQFGSPADQQERKSSLISPPCSPPTSPLQQGDEVYDEQVEGIFETEIEVITKIVRKIHPDGSITEDKKVIKIRRETKKPLPRSPNPDQIGRKGRLAYRSSNASYGSGMYHDRKDVGYVVPDEMTPFRKLYSYSEVLNCNSSMCYPVARYCVSIPNTICSSDFEINNDVVDEFKSLSAKFENILNKYKKSKSRNIISTTEYNSSLNKSDTKLLALLSEDNNFNFKSTSHFSLYKDILVMPDLKCKSCINVSNSAMSTKN